MRWPVRLTVGLVITLGLLTWGASLVTKSVMQAWFERRHPRAASDSEAVHRAAIRAKALDTLRGLLPAAVQSNLGLFGTGQAYEAMLLRMRAHPLSEARDYADQILTELAQPEAVQLRDAAVQKATDELRIYSTELKRFEEAKKEKVTDVKDPGVFRPEAFAKRHGFAYGHTNLVDRHQAENTRMASGHHAADDGAHGLGGGGLHHQ